MKLCWIYPTTRIPELEPLWQAMEESIQGLLRDDVQVEYRFLERCGNFARSLYAESLNNVFMAEAALQAQDDGFDGVLLGCWNDPLWEVREALDIPVASVGEQSMLAALTMGHRFAVATVSQKTSFSIERDLLAYGLGDRSIARPVRYLDPESTNALLLEAVADPTRQVVPRFDALAEECVADGAETIVVGCTYYAAMLRRAGYTRTSISGATVLDASAIAIKQLEAMVDIAKLTGYVKSRSGSLRTPERAKLDLQRQALGLLVPTTS
ncbi:aspartate/glutamate racemase family protein [Paeniglutamicibacter sp. MACA_103]|uniref:aspartate/glutamate racemase family protein n=1 Tax=Paeniglutamicibacter sp. MACA_103 TaxID=3377337 RepID=UPI003894F395